MTKQSETVEEIRAALDGTTERLATLEARRDDAATREEQARARRNAALMADAGSYRPELTAEVDTAAGERRAIEEVSIREGAFWAPAELTLMGYAALAASFDVDSP